MKTGPLRRAAGTAGLLALLPVGVMLLTGALTVADAALRGGAIFVAVTGVGRVAGWWMAGLLRDFEKQSEAAETPTDAESPEGRRRISDPADPPGPERRRRAPEPAAEAPT